jgi:acyl dehydratase
MSEDARAAALATLSAAVGREVHVSDWLQVTQQRVNEFAEATGDHQWIHVDVERAKAEMPGGKTIAHGFLTLSLVPRLGATIWAIEHRSRGLNYGLNKLRFPNAVKVGARIRARCTILRVEEIPGALQIAEQYTVEIEGEAKPACVAEAIMRLYF